MKQRGPVIIVIVLSLVSISLLLFAFMPRQSAQMPPSRPQLSDLKDPNIVIRKGARTLELFDGERFIKRYEMALGFTPIGDKEIAGDGKTPEGEFYVFVKNDQSRFYLSLGVSYPGLEDAERGLANKLITRREYKQIVDAIAEKQMPPQNTKLGGTIYIHGGGVGQDWTWGCIAVVDADMKEIYDVSSVGTRIKIVP